MRRFFRVDENQTEIIKALRAIGATVQPLHTVGKGCPDLLVGWRQKNFLFEIKNPAKPKRDQRKTADQEKWVREWRGPVFVVTSSLQAIGFLQSVTP